ncbi:glc8 protein [Phlyctema vagabunda]|uniref:Glc8 protein n=1 Tax=Phlyctema vagabunda TaxID=108571 RepID=A0ABR4PJH9_9HELO
MTTMATHDSATHVIHSPPSPSAKRPKGILKNSFHRSPPQQAPITTSSPPPPVHAPVRPALANTGSSDKDVTLANTLQNAGHRRSSSAARLSRRHSSTASSANDDENNQRLKWDEANLYLTEQEKSATMKIDEPKTPYAKHYEPSEDEEEEEVPMLDADEIMVDELDAAREGKTIKKSKKSREDDIPGLSLGEPEEAIPENEFEDSNEKGHRAHDKAVHVDDPIPDGQENWTKEEREKHRKFEELRKKHYEMKNVASLLGHPEELDEIDEDGDEPMNGAAR